MTALARTARVCIWPDYYDITFGDPRNQQLSGIDKPGVPVGVQADTFMEPVMGAALKQARLTEQFAFSALLQEMRPLPTSMLDLECRYVSVNRAWQEFTGRRREDVLGRVAGDYLKPEEALHHDARDRHLLEVGGRLRYETSYTHPDGSPCLAHQPGDGTGPRRPAAGHSVHLHVDNIEPQEIAPCTRLLLNCSKS